MKVVILHPPLYPVNHKFFNMLGQHIDLIVYNFGEYPRLHQNWSSAKFKNENKNYEMKIFGKGPISFKTQLNPSMLYHLMKDKPDIVISVAFWIPSLYASIIKKMLGFKFLIITDAIIETEKNISRLKKVIRKLICSNTDGLISASQLTTQYLGLLCSNIPIYSSLQTIDVREWNNEITKLENKDFLREELQLPKDKSILLGVGNFIDKKNWEAVFRQMKNLNESFFVLIGEGELENKYKKYIEANNLEDKIVIIPRKDGIELKKYFKASDLFIFPSHYDQFGYVVPEALCSGLPTVCTKYAGASSLIENGLNGYVINPNETFTNEIKMIISDLVDFQKNSRESIKKFTLENKVYEFVDIFNTLGVRNK